jgi:hypothetical protein
VSIDRSVRALFSAPPNVSPSLFMNPSPNKNPLQTWIVDLSGNIAASRGGIVFLHGQTTSLQNKCSAQRGSVDEEFARETLRRQRLEAAPKEGGNFRLGQSIGLLFEEIEI